MAEVFKPVFSPRVGDPIRAEPKAPLRNFVLVERLFCPFGDV
jgi:hypothetical protein